MVEVEVQYFRESREMDGPERLPKIIILYGRLDSLASIRQRCRVQKKFGIPAPSRHSHIKSETGCETDPLTHKGIVNSILVIELTNGVTVPRQVRIAVT